MDTQESLQSAKEMLSDILAPYGSLDHLALVCKVGKGPPGISLAADPDMEGSDPS